MHGIDDHHQRYWQYQYDVASRYMVPLLAGWGVRVERAAVLDVGCGEGGGLCAVHDAGGLCSGYDIDRIRVDLAERMRGSREITFVVGDMYAPERPFSGKRFDIVMLHDVFEHLERKDEMLQDLRGYLADRGRILITFPPYFSAFGAHQQHLKNRFARLPFFHLLPGAVSHLLGRFPDEPAGAVNEVRKLARWKMGMGSFELIARRNGLQIVGKRAYLISPNHIRFGLRPLGAGPFSRIPVVNEVACTGVVYLLAAA